MTDHDLQKEQKIQEELESLFLTLEFKLKDFDYFYAHTEDPRVFKECSKEEDFIKTLIENCLVIDSARTKTLVNLYAKEYGTDFRKVLK